MKLKERILKIADIKSKIDKLSKEYDELKSSIQEEMVKNRIDKVSSDGVLVTVVDSNRKSFSIELAKQKGYDLDDCYSISKSCYLKITLSKNED